MRLLMYSLGGTVRLGLKVGEECVDLNGLAAWNYENLGHSAIAATALANQLMPVDLANFLELGEVGLEHAKASLQQVSNLSQDVRKGLKKRQIILSLEDITYLPPIGLKSSIYCVGRNYAEHVAEAGSEVTKLPAIFFRLHNSFVGHNGKIVRPKVSQALDWEAELVAIIGKKCRYVSKKEALEYVGGYTIMNEGSLRDIQKAAPYPTAGKNFPSSGSLGPTFVTADEVPDPQALPIRSRLNGEIMQNANTADMIFNIATIIEYLSSFTPLMPGDVIATGTPAGVGFKRKPPRYLRPGDKIQFEIGNLDVLANEIVDEED